MSIKILSALLLTSFGCKATNFSSVASQGPDIVPATYHWCEGPAEKEEDGYVMLGIHNFASTVKIVVYPKAKTNESGDALQPTHEVEWESTLTPSPLLDSLLAKKHPNGQNSDHLALLASKLNPQDPKVTGWLIIAGKTIILKKMKCEKFGL